MTDYHGPIVLAVHGSFPTAENGGCGGFVEEYRAQYTSGHMGNGPPEIVARCSKCGWCRTMLVYLPKSRR